MSTSSPYLNLGHILNSDPTGAAFPQIFYWLDGDPLKFCFLEDLERQFIFSPIFCSVCETTSAVQRLEKKERQFKCFIQFQYQFEGHCNWSDLPIYHPVKHEPVLSARVDQGWMPDQVTTTGGHVASSRNATRNLI